MANEKKSLVEEALIQMKNLEQVVTENAKGILSSTMKEEIEELVKESIEEDMTYEEEMTEMESPEMKEQEEGDEFSIDLSDDEEEMEMPDMGMDIEMDSEDMMGDEDEIEPLDLSNNEVSDEELMAVIMGMGDDDVLSIKRDDDSVEADMMTKTDSMEFPLDGEDDEMEFSDMEGDEEEFEFGDEEEMAEGDYSEEEIVYEIEMEEEMYGSFGNMKRKDYKGDEYYDENNRKVRDSDLYGISGDDFDTEEFETFQQLYDKYGDKQSWFNKRDGEGMFNTYKEKTGKPFKVKTKKSEMEEEMDEMIDESMTVKPKGVGMGSGPKKVSFKGENIHPGPKGKSSEAKKFVKGGEMKEGEYGMNKGDKSKTHKGDKDYTTKKGDTLKRKAFEKNEEEMKEASRTYGNGSRNYPKREGLPKRKVEPNKALQEEVESLRLKNDEYRKALNIFREKLNEVAVFNSNLAYATRLFTEHSTTKQEKINIMRRFDNVETIKESKNLYTQIKEELSGKDSVVKESIVENIDRTPTKGSTNLVESKTYENPQFLRMKDLMSKLK